MAGVHSPAFFSSTPPISPTSRLTNRLLIAYSVSNSKIKRRKNHLRPKILKTLTKPNPFLTPLLPPREQTSHILSISSPSPNDVEGEVSVSPTENLNKPGVSTDGEDDGVVDLQVSETTGPVGNYKTFVGKLSATSVLKYSAYVVGIFVFQAICSVLFMGNDNSVHKSGVSETGDMDFNGRVKNREGLLNGNGRSEGVNVGSNMSSVVYLEDRIEMDKKINEIKVMASEARRIEERKKEEDLRDAQIHEEGSISSHRFGIEEEIAKRLIKVQKKANSSKGRLPLSNVNRVGDSENSKDEGNNKDGSNLKEVNGRLMFKKKRKYRSPSTKSAKSSKGFQVSRDHRKSNAGYSGSDNIGMPLENGSAATNNTQHVAQHNNENGRSVCEVPLEGGENVLNQIHNSSQNNGKKLEEGMGKENLQMRREDVNVGVGSGEVAQSRKLWELRRQNPHGFMGKNHKTSRTLGKGAVLNLNGNSKHGQLENMSGTNDTRVKQSNIETGFWWLKLPYVLVIFMRGGSGQEKQRGLYTAKFTSCEQDQHDSSYTVAFEDHADANNFSFLLESFFEEMGNFTVDVVPLSIQELHEAVKSNTMKVIVVKKRQLQLYAGQPLADVEEALHSLIEQNEVSSQTNFG